MAFHDSSPFNFPVASSNLKLKKYGDDSFGRHTGCDGGFKCGLALREEVLVLTTSLERIGDVWRGTNEFGREGGCVLMVDGGAVLLPKLGGRRDGDSGTDERVRPHHGTYMAECEDFLGLMRLSSGELSDKVTNFTFEMEMAGVSSDGR